MSKLQGAITVDTERCKGCALCVTACPKDAISMAKQVNLNGYNFVEMVNQDSCTGCASCAIVCPDACITVYRKKMED